MVQVPFNATTNFAAFNTAPSILWWVEPAWLDSALDGVAWCGLALSGFLLLLGTGNAVIFLILWLLYHSIVNVGQRWWVWPLRVGP